MSAVLIHVGQAGNQIGGQLWEVLKQKDASQFCESFVTQSGAVKETARGILVDSEPKVINNVL